MSDETPRLSVRIDLPNGTRFGPGKAALLRAIGETGSISGAAKSLCMSYPRAHGLVEDMNTQFGARLVEAFHGGSKRGGARVSQAGEAILARYDEITVQAAAATQDAVVRFVKAGTPDDET
ncbi:MAG: LysR family transcriptional regulator [Pseudomonadota bacterium]